MKRAVLAVMGLLLVQFANAKMVFMYEEADQKHIYLAEDDGTQASPITSGKDWHLYPDISSDGKMVAYAQGADGQNLEIVVKNLSTGLLTTVSSMKGLNLHPRFSGDGRCLAYSGPVGASGINQIVVVYLKENRQTIIQNGVASYFPSPASDCSFIVYQKNLPSGKVVVRHDFYDGSETVISEPTVGSMAPSLSFDDRWVAFTVQSGKNWNIAVYDLISQDRAQLTITTGSNMAPTFKRDRSVVFASDRNGTFELFEIKVKSLFEKSYVANKLVGKAGAIYSPNFSGDLTYSQNEKLSMPDPARSSFGTAVLNNILYVVGGHQGHEHTYPEESFLDRVDAYDFISESWKTLVSRPSAAHGYEIVAYGDYIYAFGGFTFSKDHKPKWKSLAQVDRYDVKTGTWKTVALLPRARSSYISAVVDDKVYLIGGWDSTPKFENDYDGRFHKEIDVFDLKTETVSTASFEIPKPVRRAFTGIVKDGKILLIGGLGEGATHFELLDNVTELDPRTGAARELTPLPFATFAPAAGLIGNDLYVFGGMYKLSEMAYVYVNHIYKMDGRTGVWEHTGRHLSEAKGFSRVFNVDGNRLGILGGHQYTLTTDMPVATFETFGK